MINIQQLRPVLPDDVQRRLNSGFLVALFQNALQSLCFRLGSFFSFPFETDIIVQRQPLDIFFVFRKLFRDQEFLLSVTYQICIFTECDLFAVI